MGSEPDGYRCFADAGRVSVNDTIVVFDRIRENRRLHRRESLYKVTNDSINQTLSRTVITSGLVFSVGARHGLYLAEKCCAGFHSHS